MSRRLLLSYLSLTIFVLLVLEVPLAISFARSERRALETRVERDAFALASFSEGLLEQETREGADMLVRTAIDYREQTGGRVVVVDAAGISLLDTDRPSSPPRDFSTRPEFAQAFAGEVATGTRRSETLGRNLLYVAVPVASSGRVFGAVRVTYPTATLDRRVHRYWLVLAGIGAVVLAAVSLIAFLLSREVVRPLRELESAARAAGEGDLTVRAPVDGPPEVRALATRFNEMIARLDELLRSQSDFVADASHQLRTPLAALRLRLENLAHHVDEPGEPGLESALAELERMSQLVDELLALARADAGKPDPAGPVDLRPLVEERVETWSALAEERGIELVADDGPSLLALTSAARVEQVLDNLIENALEACGSGCRVSVQARSESGFAELHVVDDGPGLDAQQRARAFDRFWRGRSGGDGSGLGLAIVYRLVELDGGRAELRKAPSGGLDAIVRLPLARPTAARS